MLTVTIDGTGKGSVLSAPPGIDCGLVCSAPFDTGSSVVLEATPDSGSTFTGWSGAGCSGTGTCTVPMNGAQTVNATFTTPAVPDTHITKASFRHRLHRATFRFSAAPGSSATAFRCGLRVGKRPVRLRLCASETSYTHLRPGSYVFVVAAQNAAGADPTPSKWAFKFRKPSPRRAA